MKPDFLVVGHIVKDVVAGGWLPGGGVLYAAAQAQALGLRVAAVTRCSSDVQPSAILPGVEWYVLPSDFSTSFENVYTNGRREQRLPALAPAIATADIPLSWRDAPIILLAPVFHDVEVTVPAALMASSNLVGLGAQGWLRRLVGEKVRGGSVDPRAEWLVGDIVFVSEEDVIDPESVDAWKRRIRTVVLTRGLHGCTVWDSSGRHDVKGMSVRETDPTGAGDVFAAAFLIRQRETGDSRLAAEFATAAAALAVQREGTAGIGGRKAIEALLHQEVVAS